MTVPSRTSRSSRDRLSWRRSRARTAKSSIGIDGPAAESIRCVVALAEAQRILRDCGSSESVGAVSAKHEGRPLLVTRRKLAGAIGVVARPADSLHAPATDEQPFGLADRDELTSQQSIFLRNPQRRAQNSTDHLERPTPVIRPSPRFAHPRSAIRARTASSVGFSGRLGRSTPRLGGSSG